MGFKRSASAVLCFAVVAGVGLTVSACGSSDSDTSSPASTSATSTAAAGGADVAAAEKKIAPYVGQANPPFPVDTPLNQKPSPGTVVSQLQFQTPFGAVFAGLVAEAAKAAGVTIKTAKAGNTASSVQSAADTIVSQKPDAVILPAAEPATFSSQLQQLDDSDVGVFSVGIMEPAKYGITGWQLDDKQIELAGQLLADWVVAKRGGDANVVFYETPELSFSEFEKRGFLEEMAAVCPDCKVRTEVVSVTEIGSTAPATVVSDLQRHPDTNQLVFATLEASVGLPAALRSAQIDVPIGGFGGDPQSLENIKNGDVEMVLANSAGLSAWTAMDMALRSAQGQELTAGEKKGFTPMQFLTQSDITFDPKFGWASDPDYMNTFKRLWQGE